MRAAHPAVGDRENTRLLLDMDLASMSLVAPQYTCNLGKPDRSGRKIGEKYLRRISSYVYSSIGLRKSTRYSCEATDHRPRLLKIPPTDVRKYVRGTERRTWPTCGLRGSESDLC